MTVSIAYTVRSAQPSYSSSSEPESEPEPPLKADGSKVHPTKDKPMDKIIDILSTTDNSTAKIFFSDFIINPQLNGSTAQRHRSRGKAQQEHKHSNARTYAPCNPTAKALQRNANSMTRPQRLCNHSAA